MVLSMYRPSNALTITRQWKNDQLSSSLEALQDQNLRLRHVD